MISNALAGPSPSPQLHAASCQLPVEHWHAWIGDATIADAILDRIMQRNHRFTLTGDSFRASGLRVIRIAGLA